MVMTRVPVSPNMLQWALDRSGVHEEPVRQKFSKFDEWMTGTVHPTLNQLEQFARTTRTPIGYFFLPEPIEEPVPIPDFRTVAGRPVSRPSPDLLETIYVCQQRQEWYRDHVHHPAESALAFVGSRRLTDRPEDVAADIRGTIDFAVDERRQFSTWTEAVRHVASRIDEAGILVMTSGIVGSNTHRILNPEEFRGFALVDDLAPLIFVNGADTKAAQMFSLAHEIAHVWLGESGLSDVSPRYLPDNDVERWCNQVAAELLVPMDILRAELGGDIGDTVSLNELARTFKVSTLVILRRLKDAGVMSLEELRQSYDAESRRLMDLVERSTGGDFYRTTSNRVSKRLARAVIAATWEGTTTFTDAFRLLNCRKASTLREMGQRLGVAV